MVRKLHLIPGVATDRRVFAALDLSDYEIEFLDWIAPRRGESIAAYARRMAERVTEPSPVLVGYSFGGMVAIEMAKHLPDATVILISSIKHYHERPMTMWLTSSLRLHRLVPTQVGKEFEFAYKWMNAPQNDEEHAFIELMRDEIDPHHTDWAIDQAVSWRHNSHTPRLYHIHGDQDRIFPIRYIRNCIPIRGGTHLMLLNKGAEIGGHIRKIVEALPIRRRLGERTP